MKHVVHKWFWAWEFEKEERWLNDMSARGLQLTDASLFRFVFEEGMPGEYQYRLELLENLDRHPESRQYIRFLEETGVTHVASVNRWAYFRKKSADGPFEIFSDIDSKISHLRRIETLLLCLLLIVVPLETLAFYHMRPTGFDYNSGTVWIYIGLAILIFGFLLMMAVAAARIAGQISKLKRERSIRE